MSPSHEGSQPNTSRRAPRLAGSRCSICGDWEPFHVHNGDERIDDYFTVGRGMTDFLAAQEWKRRALEAEAQLENIVSGSAG